MLDNAIEAIADLPERRIELTFAQKDQNRVILCKNTVAAPVLVTNKDLKTTKASASDHGFGVAAMKKIVAKYGGLIDFFDSGDMFGVQIVLPKNNQ